METVHSRRVEPARKLGQDRRERLASRPTQDQKQAQPASGETPLWELVAGVVGLLLVLGVLGFLLNEAARPQTEARVVAEVLSVTEQPGGYLVTFEAANEGRRTAASVILEGSLYDPASPGEPLESAEVTFAYIPDQSAVTGAFVFAHDPRQAELRIAVKGFTDP